MPNPDLGQLGDSFTLKGESLKLRSWFIGLREVIADQLQDANWNMDREEAEDLANNVLANAGRIPLLERVEDA